MIYCLSHNSKTMHSYTGHFKITFFFFLTGLHSGYRTVNSGVYINFLPGV